MIITAVLLFASIGRAESVVERLKTRIPGIKCQDRGSAEICVIRAVRSESPKFNYDLPVVLAIPKGGGQIVENPSRVLLHLHGFRGVCRSPDGIADDSASPEQLLMNFDMISQMNSVPELGDSILVMPMSNYRHGGGSNPYATQLIPRFESFTEWIESVTGAEESAKWSISGHSAAGSVISRALSQNLEVMPKIESVTLLDATYGIPNRIGEWKAIAKANKKVRIQSVARPGTRTEEGSIDLTNTLNKQGLARPAKHIETSVSHCSVPNKFWARTLKESLSPGHGTSGAVQKRVRVSP